jgi:hypothetical protein
VGPSLDAVEMITAIASFGSQIPGFWLSSMRPSHFTNWEKFCIVPLCSVGSNSNKRITFQVS